MADKRKSRKKREEVNLKPSKDEYAVAKYMRKHLSVKKTTFCSHKVEYFIASKAVDCLLDSPWASNKKNKETFFTNRESVVDFLNTMLIHKFFHRAKKIQVNPKDIKSKKRTSKEKEEKEELNSSVDEKKSQGKKKEKDSSKSEKHPKETDSKLKPDGSGDMPKEKKKEKKKIKLDMHLEQIFVDGNEAYVWIYDPITTASWLIGGLLVIGAILLCLFPLWPSSVRKGVYYVSVAAAGFLCVIVALIIIRIIIFCVIWLLTFGKHHLWILPNLTEDVGFFESFWPLFKYEYKGSGGTEELKKEQEEKKEKEKKENSDREPSDTETEEESGEHNTNGINNEFEFIESEEVEEEKESPSKSKHSKTKKDS